MKGGLPILPIKNGLLIKNHINDRISPIITPILPPAAPSTHEEKPRNKNFHPMMSVTKRKKIG
jgi:hypothetical protein